MSKRSNFRGVLLLAAAAWIATPAGTALCQICVIGASPRVTATPTDPMPAYEVATIKPIPADGFGPPLRMYIQEAYGISSNTAGWVIGPDWIEKSRYAINGRPPDSIRESMKNMTAADHQKKTELMMQSLLADRFRLKAHFETREMPVYELVVSKGGAKLKDAADPAKHRFGVNMNSLFDGTAATINNLIDALQCSRDIGGRKIVDKTNLGGVYDIRLQWTAQRTTGDANATAAPADVDGPSLFTAIEEQLGLKLVPTKGPGQVLVIDHIEQPTPN